MVKWFADMARKVFAFIVDAERFEGWSDEQLLAYAGAYAAGLWF